MDQIEEIKSKVDIAQLVGEYVKLARAGRNFKGLCPFHGEKTPSFMVNPELQIFKCFGCGVGGDAYAFLQKIEGIEFGEALKALAKRTGVTLESFTPTKGEEERERLFTINSLAVEYFHYLLTRHKLGVAALKYLKERGVGEKAVETFKLGFAPEGWDFLIKYLSGKKNYQIQDLERAGLVVPSPKGGYDRFRNRVMFPLNNHRGQTVGFAGRVMPGGDEKTGKYVNTPETEIYHKGDLLYGLDINKAEIKKLGWAVVVEGEVDAIASWQAGVPNVVAVKGSALTGKQVELLRRLGDRVVLGMDADLAGGSAARRGIEIAEKAGLFVETVDWSGVGEGVKDVADVATADPDKWRQMAQRVISIYSFYIDTAVKKFGFSAEGKTRAAKDVLQFLDMVSDPVRKDEYLKELAGKTEIDLDVLREQMSKIKSSDPASENKKTDDAEKLPRREMVEEYVVGLALRNGKVGQLTSPAVAQLFGTGFWVRVVEHLANNETKQSKVKDLIASLPAELKEKVAELMLVDDEADEEGVEKEWGKTVKDLEEMTIREKITTFLAQGTQTGREKELLRLTRRLNELTKEK